MFRFRDFELDVAAYKLRRGGRSIRLARDVHLIFLTVDPKWDPYRADSRFEALLGRCGFSG
jgi:hypothetical protein